MFYGVDGGCVADFVEDADALHRGEGGDGNCEYVRTWVTENRGDNGEKDAGVGADEHDDDGDGGGCGDEDDAGVG